MATRALRNVDLVPGAGYVIVPRPTGAVPDGAEAVTFLYLITVQTCPGRYARTPYVRFADGREGTVPARWLRTDPTAEKSPT